MKSLNVVVKGPNSLEVKNDLKKVLINSDLGVQNKGFIDLHTQRFGPEVISLVISSVGVLVSIIGLIINYRASKKSGKIVIIHFSGNKTEISNDIPEEELESYVKSINSKDTVMSVEYIE